MADLSKFEFIIGRGRSSEFGMDSFDLTTKGSTFSAGPLVRPSRSTAVNPTMTPCETCGTPVFLFVLKQDSGPGDQRSWFERPYLSASSEVTAVHHSRKRCQEVRDDA